MEITDYDSIPVQHVAFKRLKEIYNTGSKKNFEDVLYDIIREDALRQCLSEQFQTETDGPQNILDALFTRLLETTFHEFECFIADSIIQLEDQSDEILNPLVALQEKLYNPKIKTMCSTLLKENEPVYTCSDCATDVTCVFCAKCFFNSVHSKHNYKLHPSNGGTCDCGDPEAWSSDPWCLFHLGQEDSETSNNDNVRDSDSDIAAEIRSLKEKVNSIPVELVNRFFAIIEPLLSTIRLFLLDLNQMSSQPVPHIVLSTLPYKEGTTSQTHAPLKRRSTSSSESSENAESMDLDSPLVEIWPPPISYIPLCNLNADASQIGLDSLPRTAPKERDSASVEKRCKRQYLLARQLHPRLMTDFVNQKSTRLSNVFLTSLYNNEYHNYEQVVKTLRRVLDYSDPQSIVHVISINRDGRNIVCRNLTESLAANRAASLMRNSTALATRALNAQSHHRDVYVIETFCLQTIRWLNHMAQIAPSLRPLICHSLFGQIPDKDSQDSTHNGLYVYHPSELMKTRSFVNDLMHRFNIMWKIVRNESINLVLSVILKDPYYRYCFSYQYLRNFDIISQSSIYDDHLESDTLTQISCQIFTVISVVRWLLEDSNILDTILRNIHRSIKINSQTNPLNLDLSNFANLLNENDREDYPSSTEGMCENISSNLVTNLNNLKSKSQGNKNSSRLPLYILRYLNEEFWSITEKAIASSAEQANVSQKCLPIITFSWNPGTNLNRTYFNPFERLLSSIHYEDLTLGSLVNVRPLKGTSGPDDPGWWTQASKNNFLNFFDRFLDLLAYFQDSRYIQRATRSHVEIELEWGPDIFLLTTIINTLGLTVQVASTDPELYMDCLKMAYSVFERRVAFYDRRFRVPAYHDIDGINENLLNSCNMTLDEFRKLVSFKLFGRSTEVYAYDVNRFKISLNQPIVRLIASLISHGLEMGFTLEQLGLKKAGFANILLERPLQMFFLKSQSSSGLWVRNGMGINQYIATLITPRMKVETFDRDLQLLQQCAACMSPDDFILRLIHKFNLMDCLCNTNGDILQGKLQATKMLLSLVYEVLTNRTRPSVGIFDSNRLAFHYERLNDLGLNKDWSDLSNALVPVNFEREHANLLNDVIHILCIGPVTHSELLHRLPYQPTSSLLAQELNVSTPGPSNWAKASTSAKANKARSETVLPDLLNKIAIQKSTNDSKLVFHLKPEIMACRFNRFYIAYRHTEQNSAEETIRLKLKTLLRSFGNNEDVESSPNFPILPPAPFPILSFTREMKSILSLICCESFVRLLRHLLDIGLNQTSQDWWSDNLLEYILHLIQISLYEDRLEALSSGTYPFLDIVDRVPNSLETTEELEQILNINEATVSKSNSIGSQDWNNNCLVKRLEALLQTTVDEEHEHQIKWTLSFWRKIAMSRANYSSTNTTVANIDLNEQVEKKLSKIPSTADLEKEKRSILAKERQDKIIAKMKAQQNRVLLKYSDQTIVSPSLKEINSEHKQSEFNLSPSTSSFCALGPNRVSLFELLEQKNEEEHFICSLCLEPTEDSSSHSMLLSVHACRTSILSCTQHSKAAAWASDESMIDPTKMDNFQEKLEKKNSRHLEKLLECTLHTLVCGMNGFGEPGLLMLPNLLGVVNHLCLMRSKYVSRASLHNARSFGIKSVLNNSNSGTRVGQSLNIFPQFASNPIQTLPEPNSSPKNNYQDTYLDELRDWWKMIMYMEPPESSGDYKRFSAVRTLMVAESMAHQPVLGQSWPIHPLAYPSKVFPLDTLRAPVLITPRLSAPSDVGIFLTLCPHAMHAKCKLQHGQHIKRNFDEWIRRRNLNTVFEFRCPLCKAMSEIDLPVFGPLHMTQVPRNWLESRLDVLQSSTEKTFASWFLTMNEWITDYHEPQVTDNIDSPIITDLYFAWLLDKVLCIERGFDLVEHSYYPQNPDSTNMSQDDLLKKELSDLEKIARKILTSITKTLHYENSQMSEQVNQDVSSSSTKPFAPLLKNLRRRSQRLLVRSKNSESAASKVPENQNSHLSRVPVSFPNPDLKSPQVSECLYNMAQRIAAMYHHRPISSLISRTQGANSRPITRELIVTLNDDFDDETFFDSFGMEDENMTVILADFNEHNSAINFSNNNLSLPILRRRTVIPTTSDSNQINITNQEPKDPEIIDRAPVLTASGQPPTLYEALDELLFSLYSFEYRLKQFVKSRDNLFNPPVSPGSADTSLENPESPLTTSSSNNIIAHLKVSLEFVDKRAQQAIWSAASSWRSFRNSIAYTLTTWERTLRYKNPKCNFFNTEYGARYLTSLRYVLRAAFMAHWKHAPVFRGCRDYGTGFSKSISSPISTPTTYPGIFGPLLLGREAAHCYQVYQSNSSSFEKCPNVSCWSHNKHSLHSWWWYQFFNPDIAEPMDVDGDCVGSKRGPIPSMFETVTRIAVTNDAKTLWGLLLPKPNLLPSEAKNLFIWKVTQSVIDVIKETSQSDVKPSDPSTYPKATSLPPLCTSAVDLENVSLILDVDLTSLFVNLLFLRPGLEKSNSSLCSCNKNKESCDDNKDTESTSMDFLRIRSVNEPPIVPQTAEARSTIWGQAEPSNQQTRKDPFIALADSQLGWSCDDGRPRLPLGDCHEAILVRICFLAIVIQSIVSWQPSADLEDISDYENNLKSSAEEKANSEKFGWSDPKLLQVWKRLRVLMDLPLPTSNITEACEAANQLGDHVKKHCMPFLRIVTYVVENFTSVPVPSGLKDVLSECTNEDDTEWTLMLSYLGLSTCPTDVLSILTTADSQIDPVNDSEVFCIVTLITSWCLQARNTLSRRLNTALRKRYRLPDELDSGLLLPRPQIELPRLIPLPKDYTGLHSLAFEFLSCLSGQSNADPCICLVCGQLACMVCYACRQFETNQVNAGNSNDSTSNTQNSEHALNGIQTHMRQCHGGYGPVLRIYGCRVYMLSDQARRATIYPAPYKDVYGESDPDLKRGNPLYLVDADYERLNLLWMSHEIAALSSADIPFALFTETM